MSTGLLEITIAEFCEREAVDTSLIVTLVELDVAIPSDRGERVEDWVFDATSARWLEKALRLQRELDLDWEAVSMLVQLMRQRDSLSRENAELRRRLARFMDD